MDEYAAVVRKFYEVYRPIGRRSSKSKRTMTLLATRERLTNWKAGRGAGKTKTRDTEQHETK